MVKQVGVDICNLPEVNGYCHIIFQNGRKRDRPKTNQLRLLFNFWCWHGYFEIQINDQGSEFLSEVCKQLHELTGVEQRVTSAYHPQANGLVERQKRQNRTIKNSLVKVLEDNPEMWS